MIGKVVAGLYEGCSVYKTPERKAYYILNTNGEKVHLNKQLVASISGIPAQKDSGSKRMLVSWLDGNTSIIQIYPATQNTPPMPTPKPVYQSAPRKEPVRAPKKSKLPILIVAAILAVALAICVIFVVNSNSQTGPNVQSNGEPHATTNTSLSTEPLPPTSVPPTVPTSPSTTSTEPEEIIDPNDVRAQYRQLSSEILQYPTSNDTWSYDVYETHVVITGYLGSETSISFPKEIDGLPVKGIGSYLKNYNPFEIITIPDTIVYISERAFFKLPIRKVIFESENKLYLGSSVFAHCDQLEDMDEIVAHIYGDTIPASTFDAQENYGDGRKKYYPNQDEELYLPPNIKHIDDEAFRGQENLRIINTENIESIGSDGFRNCSSLQNVDLSSLTSLGYSAFYATVSFTEIRLYHVETVYSGTFYASGAEVVDLGIAKTVGENALNRQLLHLYLRNPECEIDASAFDYLVNPLGTMTIHGFAGSSAVEFAKRNNCAFELIKE